MALLFKEQEGIKIARINFQRMFFHDNKIAVITNKIQKTRSQNDCFVNGFLNFHSNQLVAHFYNFLYISRGNVFLFSQSFPTSLYESFLNKLGRVVIVFGVV